MTYEQPKLFDTQEPVNLPDTEVIARKIAENARPVDYDDRTSEAARDQGHGPQSFTQRAPESRDSRLFELPGSGRGRNNPYNEQLSRSDILEGMTPEEIAQQNQINKLGAKAAREVLDNLNR